MTGRELMQSHVRAFNFGVQTKEWGTMLARFADDAELRFDGIPVGPFIGIEAIRKAYDEEPPDDEIVLLGIQDDPERQVVVAGFAWQEGGPGRLVLEHDRGVITRLTVIFD
jgi:steroid delta-isomerase